MRPSDTYVLEGAPKKMSIVGLYDVFFNEEVV
jgi:hypothetical protein